jgi:pyruvate formate lyase activating enzyme
VSLVELAKTVAPAGLAAAPATPALAMGVVTEVQRFSVHDGPGIRTTVFLKGCNLRCLWCHNPETIGLRPQLAYLAANCVGCAACVEACPSGAITWQAGRPVTDFARCGDCFACVEACFAGARVRIGRAVAPEALLAEIMADKPYYGDDGGVTFSGGEPLIQRGFVAQMVELCRREGIHCAVETALAFPWGSIKAVLASLDLVMFDVKAMDEALHRRVTGRSNKQVLANARRLAEAGIPAIVRTPVIPGVNEQEVVAIAEFVATLDNVTAHELLPYNPFAEEKFTRLGLPFAVAGLKAPAASRMRELVDLARAAGSPARRMED